MIFEESMNSAVVLPSDEKGSEEYVEEAREESEEEGEGDSRSGMSRVGKWKGREELVGRRGTSARQEVSKRFLYHSNMETKRRAGYYHLASATVLFSSQVLFAPPS